MVLTPALLERVLTTPSSIDVARSPAVTAIVLADPANAADLVPALREQGSRRHLNARRVLCLFGAAAVPHVLSASRDAEPTVLEEVVEIIWAMFVGADRRTIRDVLAMSRSDVDALLADRRWPPDDLPEFVEQDFRARICDLLYVILQLLADPTFDRSEFRMLDEEGRDREIEAMKARSLG